MDETEKSKDINGIGTVHIHNLKPSIHYRLLGLCIGKIVCSLVFSGFFGQGGARVMSVGFLILRESKGYEPGA